MSVFIESRIKLDFSSAASVFQYDKPAPGQGNSVWPGVDFCIEESPEWIWLEIKSWDPSHIPAKDRGGSRWSFICKMKSKAYTKELRNKFLATTAFLAWPGMDKQGRETIPMYPCRMHWKTTCLLSVLGVGLVFSAGRVLHHNVLNAALIATVERGEAADAEDLLRRGADADAAKPWFHSIPPSRNDWYWFFENSRDKGNAPQPILCLASKQHDLPMVNLLLAHGANANARSVHDYTALNYAAGDAGLTRLLVRRGANRNARDVFGDSALPATPATMRSNEPKLGMNKQTPAGYSQEGE